MSRATESSIDDAVLVEASWQEPDRFADVFDRHYADIHGYVARRLGRGLADDLAAETFLVAFDRRRRWSRSRTATATCWCSWPGRSSRATSSSCTTPGARPTPRPTLRARARSALLARAVPRTRRRLVPRLVAAAALALMVAAGLVAVRDLAGPETVPNASGGRPALLVGQTEDWLREEFLLDAETYTYLGQSGTVVRDAIIDPAKAGNDTGEVDRGHKVVAERLTTAIVDHPGQRR